MTKLLTVYFHQKTSKNCRTKLIFFFCSLPDWLTSCLTSFWNKLLFLHQGRQSLPRLNTKPPNLHPSFVLICSANVSQVRKFTLSLSHLCPTSVTSVTVYFVGHVWFVHVNWRIVPLKGNPVSVDLFNVSVFLGETNRFRALEKLVLMFSPEGNQMKVKSQDASNKLLQVL